MSRKLISANEYGCFAGSGGTLNKSMNKQINETGLRNALEAMRWQVLAGNKLNLNSMTQKNVLRCLKTPVPVFLTFNVYCYAAHVIK